MTRDSSAKDEGATAPQSPIVRHLGLIKAMSVIMAILIVAALVVIVVTIYSRLTTMEQNAEPRQSEISLPAGARVSCASMGEKGQMLLLIEQDNRQQIWQFDRSGRLQRQIEIRPSTP
jgi:heme/copper-type cytochrome/quinol oxidase subunit 2